MNWIFRPIKIENYCLILPYWNDAESAVQNGKAG